MIKAKVILIDSYSFYQYDYYDPLNILFPASGDWEEFSEDDLRDLKNLVIEANSANSCRNKKYIVVEYSEAMKEGLYASAKEFADKQRKENERREKAAAEAKRKRQEKDLERKRKQLEKLKRELGEEND